MTRRLTTLSLRQIGAALHITAPTAADWLRRGIIEIRDGEPVIVGRVPRVGRPVGARDRQPRKRGRWPQREGR